MKIAFALNLFFAIFELLGGMLTGSVAILSDALHDLGDSIGIGISLFCEQKSYKGANDIYTYGYIRYSLLGGFFTTGILLIGSIFLMVQSVHHLFSQHAINYNGMVLFAVIGVLVNGLAVLFTRHGHSVNQKAVNLHMLEDVISWFVVLIGALVMRFTGFIYLDSILSLGVAVYILIHACINLKTVFNVFLEKIPENVNFREIKQRIAMIDGVIFLYHLHVRSVDGIHHAATMHLVVQNNNVSNIKKEVRRILEEYNIVHVTIETEETLSHEEYDCPLENLHYCDHHH